MRPYDLDLKLGELKINGYVIFEELFAVETIDRVHAAFMPLIEQVREKTRKLDPKLPRPELVSCYSLPWFAEHGGHDDPRRVRY